MVIGAPPFTRVSKPKSLNRDECKNPEMPKHLEAKDRILLHFYTDVYMDRHSKGRWFLHEHPWDADSWSDERIQKVALMPGVFVVRGDMCAWGLHRNIVADQIPAFVRLVLNS